MALSLRCGWQLEDTDMGILRTYFIMVGVVAMVLGALPPIGWAFRMWINYWQ